MALLTAEPGADEDDPGAELEDILELLLPGELLEEETAEPILEVLALVGLELAPEAPVLTLLLVLLIPLLLLEEPEAAEPVD